MGEIKKIDTSESTLRILTFALLFIPILIKNFQLFKLFFPETFSLIAWATNSPNQFHEWLPEILVYFFTFAIMVFGIHALLIFFLIPKMYIRKYKLVPAIDEYPAIVRRVNKLAFKAGLKKSPKVYVFEGANSFSFGRWSGDARIAIGRTYITHFKKRKDLLDAIITHEIAHVLNKDIWLVSWAQSMYGYLKYWFILFVCIGLAIPSMQALRYGSYLPGSLLSIEFIEFLKIVPSYFLFLVAFPALILSSTSRKREVLADSRALTIVDKAKLIEALREAQTLKVETNLIEAMKSPKYISLLPRKFKEHGFLSRLFATHPYVHERIEILKSEEYINTDTKSRIPDYWSAINIGIISFYLGVVVGNIFSAIYGIEYTSPVSSSLLTFGALQDIGFVTTVSPCLVVLFNLWIWRNTGLRMGLTSMLSRIAIGLVVLHFLLNIIYVLPIFSIMVVYEQTNYFLIVAAVLVCIVLSFYADRPIRRFIGKF